MKKMKFGILILVAIIALVSVASASLPSGLNAVQATMLFPNPSANSYWGVDVTAGVNDELPIASYDGFCTDTTRTLTTGAHSFTAYSSLDSGSFVSGMPSVDWPQVNWILNHPSSNWMITQAAIWHFDGERCEPYPYAYGVWPSTMGAGGYNKAAYDAYIADIPSDFTPTCREPIYAIILYDAGHQEIIVPGVKDCTNTPEFPTLALPVAMLIGLVGAVQYVKSRKE